MPVAIDLALHPCTRVRTTEDFKQLMKKISTVSQRELAGIGQFALCMLPPWSTVNRMVLSSIAQMIGRERLARKYPGEVSALIAHIDCAFASIWNSSKLARMTEEEFIALYETGLELVMGIQAAKRVFGEDKRWKNRHGDVISLMAQGTTASRLVGPKASLVTADYLKASIDDIYSEHLVDVKSGKITVGSVNHCKHLIKQVVDSIKAEEVLKGHRMVSINVGIDDQEVKVKSLQDELGAREGAAKCQLARNKGIKPLPIEPILWPDSIKRPNVEITSSAATEINASRELLIQAVGRARCSCLESVIKVVARREADAVAAAGSACVDVAWIKDLAKKGPIIVQNAILDKFPTPIHDIDLDTVIASIQRVKSL